MTLLPRTARLALALSALALACSSSSLPDPKSAADEYARAAARGDADAIYGMMTSSAQKARSKDDVRTIVATERTELAEQAKALSAKDVRIDATARLRFEDGAETALELKEGRFYVTSARALPGA